MNGFVFNARKLQKTRVHGIIRMGLNYVVFMCTYVAICTFDA